MNKRTFLFILLVVSMTAMATTIYKWVDDDGRVRYSDKPPLEGDFESRTIDEQRQRTRSLEGRIISGEYRTWDGTIRIKLPYLVQPGARIEAQQIDAITSGLFMWDDFGQVYKVLITVNEELKLTMDDIIQNLQPQYELLSKKVVNTVRGKELRLVSFREGGSPIASQRLEGGKLTEKKQLNMIAAGTLFLSGKDNDVIEVVAGVTQGVFGQTSRTRTEDQEHLTKWAEENLEKFLEGIVISA